MGIKSKDLKKYDVEFLAQVAINGVLADPCKICELKGSCDIVYTGTCPLYRKIIVKLLPLRKEV